MEELVNATENHVYLVLRILWVNKQANNGVIVFEFGVGLLAFTEYVQEVCSIFPLTIMHTSTVAVLQLKASCSNVGEVIMYGKTLLMTLLKNGLEAFKNKQQQQQKKNKNHLQLAK